MTTATANAKVMNKPAIWETNGIGVPITITDTKQSYGKLRYFVTGRNGVIIDGKGRWIDSDKVRILPTYADAMQATMEVE